MRLKSFYAKTMTEAMQMVRDTLGEDAIIVATRDEKGGKAVRVTAAIDPGYNTRSPAFEIGRGEPAAADDWLQYDEEEEESAITEEITEVMLRHSVPEDVMDQILSCATVIGLEEPSIALIAAIEHLYNFRPLPQQAHKKALMMMGPPGSGKTLAAAKIAARGVMNGLNIGVVSCDTVRAGGIEQLQSFTKLLRIDLKKAATAQELATTLQSMQGRYDQIIIDTPGLNPFDKEEVKNAARMIGSGDIEAFMVLPAGTDADEAGEMARIFAAVGAHNLIPTRLDIARRLGGILSAAHYGGMTFAEASNTAKVADGLFGLDPRSLSGLLMPGGYKNREKGYKKAGSRQ